jgi:serine phosphatase RsbU (regulator of sigma subunit)
MPGLKILNGIRAEQCYALGDREMIVGRDGTCDIVLANRTVSRQHARIIPEDGSYFIEDLQSVNGTYVNGQRVQLRTRLADQDRIQIHDTVLSYLERYPHAGRYEADDEPENGDSLHVAPEFDALAERLTAAADRIVSTIDVRTSAEQRAEANSRTKLQAILEITRSLGTSLELHEVLPNILSSLFRIFPQADHGYILQNERAGGRLVTKAIKHRRDEHDTISPIGGGIAARVMSEGKAFLSGARSDDTLDESVFDDRSRSVMCAPLMGPSQVPLGVLHIDTDDPRRPFSQQDLDVLASVAILAGQAVEYARLHESSLDADRRKRELMVARDVQLQFLPKHRPDIRGYQFYDYYRAADSVAGDYYDYVDLPGGRLGIVIGDVAGKGVTAALMMARLFSDVRYCLLSTPSPAEALKQLNRQLSTHLLDGRFVTLALCVLDPAEHTVTVANAGHLPPVLRRADSRGIEELALGESNWPLGVAYGTDYRACNVPLAPGDLVLCYTDGVSEAMNPRHELYGVDSVMEVLARAPHSVQHVGQCLVADVQHFSEGRLPSDDMCLICFSRDR